jgi:hypothetical protein
MPEETMPSRRYRKACPQGAWHTAKPEQPYTSWDILFHLPKALVPEIPRRPVVTCARFSAYVNAPRVTALSLSVPHNYYNLEREIQAARRADDGAA